MEPRQNRPVGGYENVPHERGDLGAQSPASVGGGHERQEVLPSSPEREPHHAADSMPSLPVPVPVAVPQPIAPQAGGGAAVPSDDTSLSAADEDLIEKEWVDKAKKIISETRDDPSAREKAVSKLQAEYIRKRYGRIIGGQQNG